MPKIKTNRGAAKRFSKTSTGRVKRKKAFLRHILTGVSRKNKRQLRKGGMVHVSDEARIKKLIPY